MTRIAAGIQYQGTTYCGWQRQQALPSVQAAVENAFSKVADHPVEVFCAGRTDRGVHATGQVIHFDTDATRSDYAWLCGANSHLPRDVAIVWVKPVAEPFHARFSALSRTYQYYLYNGPTRPAIGGSSVSWHFKPLEFTRMQEAAALLQGTHDFSSFRAVSCQAHSPIRTIYSIALEGNLPWIKLSVCANGFLHHMVRNILGVLLKIGEGEKPVDWITDLLVSRDRAQAGITAPAQGLYLTQVTYSPEWQIPERSHSLLDIIRL